MLQEKVILLFFKDFERDSVLPYDRYLKRLIRPIYHRFKKGQKTSGFAVWCQLLIRALEQEGYTVHLNNYALAFRNPHYPVGLVGYPHLLEGWSLPNPAILGPSLFDHPQNAPNLLDDARYQLYLVTCDWMQAMFTPAYGDRCVQWYAGMDTEQWPDTRYHRKSIDVLVYDKIRWNRDFYEPSLLNPILDHLQSKGLTYEIVRYGAYDHEQYKQFLAESRTMLFLCEHETQGMAYQEALASNVPLLAWDQGWWLDPNRPKFTPNPVPATSVPYFAPICGEKFMGIDDFYNAFERFWDRLDIYEPRQFVEKRLSFKGSAECYARYYTQVAIANSQQSAVSHQPLATSNHHAP